MTMFGLVLALLLVSSCTFGGDATQAPTSESRPADGTSRMLPDFCDELVSPLMVASVVQRELRGGRTAEYAAPGDERGLTEGMTCRQGVEISGPSLTVSASAFTDGKLARSALRRAASKRSPGGADVASADRVRVLGRDVMIIESAVATTFLVPDGSCLLEVRLRRGIVPDDQMRLVLIEISSAVLTKLPNRRSAAGR